MTPQQATAQLTAHHDTADQFTPYSLGHRVAAARLAEVIPNGPTREFLLDIAAGNDTTPARKEPRP